MDNDFGILPYNSIEIGGGFLAISNFGSWCHLSEGEFDALRRYDIRGNPALVEKLREKGILLGKGNANKTVSDFRNLNRFLMQGPSLHIVVPTLKCNHECVYCHAKTPKEDALDMDKETAIRVLDFVFKTESPAITIEFQGGEPLMGWETVKFIVEEARSLNEKYEKRNLAITIVTNLTLMDDEKLDFLTKNGVSICTSLDGPKHVHDANRKYFGGGSAYDDVTRWIGKINGDYKRRGLNLRVNALPTITRQSLPYWKEIVNEYVSMGFDIIHLKFLNRLGAASESWEVIAYTPEEFIGFWEKAMNYIIELNKKGTRIVERMAQVMLTKMLLKKDYGFTELMSPCGAGRTQLLYNCNGDIYTCDEGRMLGNDLFSLGNVKKDSYNDIIRSDKLIGVCHSSMLDNYCGMCAYKPYCGTCPVMNFAEQGTVVPSITETMRCKIYKAQFTYLFNRIIKDFETLEIFRGWVDEGKDKGKTA